MNYTYRITILLLIFVNSGCATYSIAEKSETTSYKGYGINYIDEAFIDLDDNKTYVCFRGQKFFNVYNDLRNREVESYYVSTIDGLKENDNYEAKLYGKQSLNLTDLDEIKCDYFVRNKKTINLPIFIAESVRRTKDSNMCVVTSWVKLEIDKKIEITKVEDQCHMNRKSAKYLTETIRKSKDYEHGVYVVFKDRKYTKNKFETDAVRIKNHEGAYPFYISGSRSMSNPYAPLLIPFALVFDIVTFPFQAVYFLTTGYNE